MNKSDCSYFRKNEIYHSSFTIVPVIVKGVISIKVVPFVCVFQIFFGLIKNKNKIIIKETDKGSASVIMDRDLYLNKIPQILTDETSYKLLQTNIDKNKSEMAKLYNKY